MMLRIENSKESFRGVLKYICKMDVGKYPGSSLFLVGC